MKFFKKIDDYLLHFYPSIWVTRVHYFLPIGIVVMILLYLANIAIGWDPKDNRPDGEWVIFMLVIPVLVYLVYWFIFQSRYNVGKSGGKLSLFQEYLNFFLYTSVFCVAYGIILVVPFSNDHKLMLSVGKEEVLLDIKHLNEGNTLVNWQGDITVLNYDKYRVRESQFVGDYYYDDYHYSDFDSENNTVILTKREVLQRIDNYKASYNKYSKNMITKSAEHILDDRLNDIGQDDSYGLYDYYGHTWSVSGKVSKIRRLHLGEGFALWDEPWFWKISLAFMAWLALVVWIFKQMNLRHFVFGFISLCLTPVVAGIIGAIIYGVFYSSRSSSRIEDLFFTLIIFAYAIVTIIVVRGYRQNKLNQTAYVMTMYLHFWLPLLPFFLYFTIWSLQRRGYYGYYDYYHQQILGYDWENVVYTLSVVLGLASIAIFKPVYAKFRALPMQK